MIVTTLTSREFEQDVSRAKNAALKGPVILTDTGESTHVLLSMKEYLLLTRGRRNVADTFGMPGIDEIDFEPVRAFIGTKLADLE